MSGVFELPGPAAAATIARDYHFDESIKFKPLTRWLLATISQFADFFAISLAALICYLINDGPKTDPHYSDVIGSIVIAFISILSFRQGGIYSSDIIISETQVISSVIIRYSMTFLIVAAASAFAHIERQFSRAWFIELYGTGAIFLSIERVGFGIAVKRLIARGYTTLSVAVIGMNSLTDQLIDRLAHNRVGIRFVGVFGDQNVDGTDDSPHGPKLPDIDALIDLTHKQPVDLVIITTPIEEFPSIKTTVEKLLPHPLSVRILPGAIGLDRLSPIRLSRSELPGIQLIKIADRPISDVALLVKSTTDKIVALFALVVASPILFACAMGIAMTSPGPVLFRQRRVGFRGKEFSIIKFRTMDFVHVGNYVPTRLGDRRVFPFGRFLRRTSLDELPQLLNVLKGDMSLVGPRPHVPEQTVEGRSFYDAVNQYAGRHRVKPGMTGWAQVNGWRGPAETMEQIEKRIEHDIFYVENWSFLLDVIIMIKTVFICLAGRNAF